MAVEVVDASIAVVRGWLAHKLALEAGIRPVFSGVHSGWMFDTARLPDLVAHLERRRIAFDVIEPEPATGVSPETHVDPEPVEPEQLDLFGLDGGR